MNDSQACRARHFASALIATLACGLAACGSSGGGSGFEVQTAAMVPTPSASIVVAGEWMVYFAGEALNGAGGTNLNDNGEDDDEVDSVAVAVDLRSRMETNLGVAARDALVLGEQVYLLVDESNLEDRNADDFDWTMDGAKDDFALLHWSAAAGSVSRVDVVASDVRLVLAGGRLFYASLGAALGTPDETTLRFVDEGSPTTPRAVAAEAGGFLAFGGTLTVVRALGQDSGLLLCALDETADGGIYNGDGDDFDEAVLVLLDATADPLGTLRNTALAMASVDEPIDALGLGAHDWLVTFLVDEMAQGMTNLNDDALALPVHCPLADADMDDRVLHYLEFAALVAGTPAVNTGLAGHDRVLALDGFVATISAEGEASCNLNRGATITDMDMDDHVLRWVATTPGAVPERDQDVLHALAIAIGGGSWGVAVLDDRFVAVIDEQADTRNLDGKTANHELVAWLDPAAAPPSWTFAHQAANRTIGTGVFDRQNDSEPYAGTSWMAAEAVGSRLALVFLEEVPGTNADVGSLNTNLRCGFVEKDTDKVDGLPVWADFEAGPTLDFDGMGYSVDKANAGIEIAAGFAFFRVSEADDKEDYDGDGQENDVVLFRNPLTTCGPVFMGTASSLIGPVVTTDRRANAAFLSAGRVRHFRF